MPTSTYTPISTQTLGSPQTSVTFNSFSGYTDLVLVANSIVSSGTGNDIAIRFNGDTGTNYSNTYLLGTGSSAISGRGSNFTYADSGFLSANSGAPNTRIVQIQNYANTTTYKTLLTRASSENGVNVAAYVNMWRSTAAITSMTIYSAGALTYATGSIFTLYGIKAE